MIVVDGLLFTLVVKMPPSRRSRDRGWLAGDFGMGQSRSPRPEISVTGVWWRSGFWMIQNNLSGWATKNLSLGMSVMGSFLTVEVLVFGFDSGGVEWSKLVPDLEMHMWAIFIHVLPLHILIRIAATRGPLALAFGDYIGWQLSWSVENQSLFMACLFEEAYDEFSAYRHFSTDEHCPVCNLAIEDVYHVFRGISQLFTVTFFVRADKLDEFVSSELNTWLLVNLADVSPTWDILFGALLWYIWLDRNDRMFNNKLDDNGVIMERSKRLHLLCTLARQEVVHGQLSMAPHTHSGEGATTCGGVFRDCQGRWIVEVELDCQQALHLLQPNRIGGGTLSILVRIHAILQRNWCVRFQYISR
ncbi:hypothetical protein F3Y22_tig00110332pilonHSYRG00545 [Hibiscus syriacus]|uniref:Uncharacterized protein n=1 Tax=Hibiscus syriacus TaxID=106335 RepID=A0A6A3AWE3_HIBSY|nr:hypothetical protein F3Y22_tig00110332pilonHSYRG00545 [Hibiscus syriacus]